MPKVHVAPLDEFGPGSLKLVELGWTSIGVYNCNGELLAVEDRCSHDDGPLAKGEWDEDALPRHLPAPRRGVRPPDGQSR